MTSRKPRVVMMPVFAPRRSSSALVPTVVPWTTAPPICALPSAAKPFKLSDVMRTYDVKIDLTMESNFSFQADPAGCTGKGEGYAGAGQEIIKMSSPKPVRVTLYVPPKGEKGERHIMVLPAYDQAIKASHIFNLLDARGVISVTERQAYILRVRELAKACCAAWLKTEGGGA